eukprot:s1539_g16.t1
MIEVVSVQEMDLSFSGMDRPLFSIQSSGCRPGASPLALDEIVVDPADQVTTKDGTVAARFLSAVVDCVVVHACTGLQDFPRWAVDRTTSLPGEHGLLGYMDRNETKDIRWAFDYWRSRGKELFKEFASLYYGYLLAIIADQLKAAAFKQDAPRLTITVVSDTNLVPLLAMYGLKRASSRRPPYLSALIHELYQHRNSSMFVRVLYNGRVQKVCHGRFPLCPLQEWDDLVKGFTPSNESCPVLYEAYDFWLPRNHLAPDRPWQPPMTPAWSKNILSTAFVLPASLGTLCCFCLGWSCCRRRRLWHSGSRSFDDEEGLREALMT